MLNLIIHNQSEDQKKAVAAPAPALLAPRPAPWSRGEGKEGPGAHSCAGTRPELSCGGGF